MRGYQAELGERVDAHVLQGAHLPEHNLSQLGLGLQCNFNALECRGARPPTITPESTSMSVD